MYFSEKGNVDDDATLITIFLVSFNLQSCCLMQSAVCGLQSAVCGLHSAVCSLQSAVFSLQMSYTGFWWENDFIRLTAKNNIQLML